MSEFQSALGNERIQFRIRGDDIQTVEFKMLPDTRLVVQPGVFLAGIGGISGIGVTFGKDLLTPLKRAWSGENAVLQELTCEDEPAQVVIGAPKIGRIVHIPLRGEKSFICQRGAFIASTGDIDLSIAFTKKIRAGLFGGQGLVFQRVSGVGDVFLHATGTVVDWTLTSSRVVRVSTNNILAFEDSVGYDVQLSGGLMTLLFGRQGLFLSQLEGPGRVIVQSVDHDAFAQSLGKVSRNMRRQMEKMDRVQGKQGS